MSGPVNGILGEQDLPTTLPETQVPADALTEEKKRARYSKTEEFRSIKKYWEDRREFFQKYLPSGGELRFVVPDEKVAQQWVLANNIVTEINVFLSFYEGSAEAVDNAGREDT